MTRTKSMRTAGQSVFSVAPTCVPFSFLVWRASKSSSNYQNNPGRDTIEPSGCGAGRLSEPILSEVDPVVAYSNTTERAAASEQLIVNTILPGLHGVKPDRGRDGWSFHCPLDHRKQNAPAAIWVSDDGWISVHCFDCRRNDELRELLVAPHLRHRSALPVAAPRQSSPPPRPQPRTDYPVRVWTETTAIPADAGHPARRWLAQRNLWRPEVAAPAPLRWLPAALTRPGPHTGAGSLVHCWPSPRRGPRLGPSCPLPRRLRSSPLIRMASRLWTVRHQQTAWASARWDRRSGRF